MSYLIDSYKVNAFTPLNLTSVIAWWDASDASTFTYSSGTVVSAWASKVGSYTLGNSTSGNRPSRSATVNSLDAVDFATSKSLSVASFDMTGGQKFSVWAVFTAPSGTDRVVAEQTTNYANNAGAWGAFRLAANTASLGKRGATANATFGSTDTVTTTAKAFIGTHDGTLSTDETSGWLNGSGSGTRPANNDTNSNNLSSTLYVGARAGTGLYLNGVICELGVTTAVMTSTERASLETYLSAKWGLGF